MMMQESETNLNYLAELQVQLDLGNNEQALKLIDLAIRKSVPMQLLQEKIRLLIESGRASEAVANFQQFATLYPDSPEGRRLLNKLERSLDQRLKNSPENVPEKFKVMSAKEYLKLFPSGGIAIAASLFENDNSRTTTLSQLSNFTLYGRGAIPINAEDVVLTDSLLHEDLSSELEIVLQSQYSETPTKVLNGEYLPLYGKWCDGFWHWIMECLPAILIAESAGYKGKYIVPAGGSFINESIQLLDISSDRVLPYLGGNLQIENLFLVERIAGSGLNQYRGLTLELRRRLLTAVGIKAEPQGANRLYLTRNFGERPRRIVNENELAELLVKYQFETVCLERLSLHEQIIITSQASVLFGPHGAGMLHALFMPRGSLVMELFSPLYINTANLPAIDFLNHRYRIMPSLNTDGKYQYGEDINISRYLLDLLLRQELLPK